MGLAYLPITMGTLSELAAVLRASDYRSAPSYLGLWRKEHTLAGHKWTEALNCLVDPEHRTRYWLQMIYDCVREKGQDAKPRVDALFEKMMADVGQA